MSALDGVLADLVEADRECAYVTVKREPLEALIGEWLSRGDQIAILASLITRVRKELATLSIPHKLNRDSQEAVLRELNAATAQLSTTIAHHRHAVRQEFAARLKQPLRSAISEIHQHAVDALLKGENELAERLESERQTVQLVMNAIDAMMNWFVTQELAKAREESASNGTPST
jgi:hypothetical protein